MVIFIFFKCKKWQSALQKRVLNNYESRLFPFKKVSFHILHKTGRNPCNELCVTSARAAPPLHKYPFCTHYILEQLLICKNHRSNLNSYNLYYRRTIVRKICLFEFHQYLHKKNFSTSVYVFQCFCTLIFEFYTY